MLIDMEQGEVWISDLDGTNYRHIGTMAADGLSYRRGDEVSTRLWVRDPESDEMREVALPAFVWPPKPITVTTTITPAAFEVLSGLCWKCHQPLGPCTACAGLALCGESWCQACRPE